MKDFNNNILILFQVFSSICKSGENITVDPQYQCMVYSPKSVDWLQQNNISTVNLEHSQVHTDLNK